VADVLTIGDGSTTPRIAWESVLEDSANTCPSTTESDGPLPNAFNWLPWSFWRPTGAGPHVITAVLSGAKTVNAWAISGHDASGLIGMDTWNGSAWVLFSEAVVTDDGSVRYFTGTPVITTKLRFRFATVTFLAILWAGEDLILPEGFAPGWTDPVLALRADTTPEVSRSGVWLGVSVEQWMAQLSIDISHVDAAWARDEWLPFLRRCSTQPFLLHWHSADWPNSACLCTAAKFGNAAFTGKDFVALSVSFNADPGFDRRLTPLESP
jgi:hypothetical protein